MKLARLIGALLLVATLVFATAAEANTLSIGKARAKARSYAASHLQLTLHGVPIYYMTSVTVTDCYRISRRVVDCDVEGYNESTDHYFCGSYVRVRLSRSGYLSARYGGTPARC
jgi:hypothetical protein